MSHEGCSAGIRRRLSGAAGQATMEYLLVTAMITGCLIAYPLMMRAYDAYLDSIFFILELALP